MKAFILRLFLLLALGALSLPLGLRAQVLSNTPSATLNASLPESLSVSLTGATSVSFTLTAGGVAAGDNPVDIQTSWVLRPSRTAVTLAGYFDTTSALTDPGPPSASIDSANVLGQVTTGTPTSFTAFTQTVTGVGTPGASLELFTETITGSNKNASRTDSLNLEIDLTSAPQQPAGDYTGTLHIQAVAL